MLQTPSSLVSVDWLHDNLDAKNLVVLDATIPKVTSKNEEDSNQLQIPATRFFDLKQKFSDTAAPFPNTFPSAKQFTKEAQNLGINKDSAIVVYDAKGIYSSARVWWMFKAFGHDNVAVLDGGLPEWKNRNFNVEQKYNYSGKLGSFEAQLHPELMKFFEDVLAVTQNSTHKILDARSESRFKGVEPEPRADLRSGTIPNSINLPFENLLNGHTFKNTDDLKNIFSKLIKPDDKVICSCGSGITACVLALGAEISGYKNFSIYDGSWTEWGSLTTQ